LLVAPGKARYKKKKPRRGFGAQFLMRICYQSRYILVKEKVSKKVEQAKGLESNKIAR
jgi:hypothetical protein